MPDQIPDPTPNDRRISDSIVPQVRDMRSKILGLLPKDAQARVLGGIALVMAFVIMFSGRKTPPARPRPAPAREAAAGSVNQARIQEYRARIEEQAQKLAMEEARFKEARQGMAL